LHFASCQTAEALGWAYERPSDFTSGVYRGTKAGAAFPKEKTHFAKVACEEQE
jgi:hypothetical protein